jgi:hypothetical protein
MRTFSACSARAGLDAASAFSLPADFAVDFFAGVVLVAGASVGTTVVLLSCFLVAINFEFNFFEYNEEYFLV